MAMTLRLTDEQDRALTLLAKADGVSKQEAACRAIVEAAARRTHDTRVREPSERGRTRYSDLLDRRSRLATYVFYGLNGYDVVAPDDEHTISSLRWPRARPITARLQRVGELDSASTLMGFRECEFGDESPARRVVKFTFAVWPGPVALDSPPPPKGRGRAAAPT